MGILKSMKDMKNMVAATPAMIDQAQVLQPQANQMQTAMAQQAQAQTVAAFANPSATPGLSADLIAPVAGVTAATTFNGRVTSSPAFAQHFNTLYRVG